MNEEKFEQNDYGCSGYCDGCEKFAEEQKNAEEKSEKELEREKAIREHEDLRKLDRLAKELEEKNKQYKKKKWK